MDSWANTDWIYKFRNGDRANRQAPSPEAQAQGFKPTYYDSGNRLVMGDDLRVSELNYIFNDLYAKAAQIEAALTAQGL